MCVHWYMCSVITSYYFIFKTFIRYCKRLVHLQSCQSNFPFDLKLEHLPLQAIYRCLTIIHAYHFGTDKPLTAVYKLPLKQNRRVPFVRILCTTLQNLQCPPSFISHLLYRLNRWLIIFRGNFEQRRFTEDFRQSFS